jgi:hypothetical protein
MLIFEPSEDNDREPISAFCNELSKNESVNFSYLHPNMADTENGKLEYPCFLFVFSLFSNIVISNV